MTWLAIAVGALGLIIIATVLIRVSRDRRRR